MTDIIDFEEGKDKEKRRKAEELRKENEPSGFCKMDMPDGTYYLFNIGYAFNGKPWSFEIWAKSEQEAWQRVQAIKSLPVDVSQTYHQESY